jgi:cytochrome c biogenesis protein CcmG, thiol:disulfide interchange protein DsbE
VLPLTVARAGAGLAVAVVAGLLAVLGLGLAAARDERSPDGVPVNRQGAAIDLRPRPARPFTLRLFGGGEFRLSDQRGKPTLVNFWASWCAPCREEAPALESVHRAYGGRGLALVGFDLWDNEDDARAFLAEVGATYPNGVEADGGTAVEYGVRGIPETFAIERDGRLVRRWIGPFTEAQLTAFVDELLARP